MENATEQAPLERSPAAFGGVSKDLLVTNATKREYCSRAARTELTGAFQANEFGTPIRSQAAGCGRPKGYHLAGG
jgi:hypothetical protein